MNRKGWDSTRRNKKIGTSDSGWKKQSQFVIPERWENWKPYYEHLTNPIMIQRSVRSAQVEFIVEPTRDDSIHVCTPDDIVYMLNLLPNEMVFGCNPIGGVVMRQPTRKQTTIHSVWGRICYHAEIGAINGPAIFIEAVPRDWNEIAWDKKLDLESQGELERMKSLIPNHRVGRRKISFDFGLEEKRRWLLYHTLIHELGHWHDYQTKVIHPQDPESMGMTLDQRHERYFKRPVSEREAFAHRFSDEWRNRLMKEEALPFERQFDEHQFRIEGGDPGWFL